MTNSINRFYFIKLENTNWSLDHNNIKKKRIQETGMHNTAGKAVN